MKKVCILINAMAGGGAERAIAQVAQQIDPNKYALHFVFLEDIQAYSIDPKIPQTILCKGKRSLLWMPIALWRFCRWLKQHQPDMILSSLTRAHLLSILSKVSYPQGKRIISEQTDTYAAYAKRPVFSALLKYLLSFADGAHFVSKGIEWSWRTRAHFRQPSKVIFNPIDLERIQEASQEDLPQDAQEFFNAKVIVHAGRLVPQKNQMLLLDAFALLPGDYRLAILGEGPLEGALRDKAEALGLGARVQFLGFQENPYRYFKRGSLMVYSSDFEGLPIAMLEAMACGLPVVSTDCPSGPREILAPGTKVFVHLQPGQGNELAEYGVLVAMADAQGLAQAMKSLCENASLHASYAEKSRQRAEDFALDKISREYEVLLSGLV
ncbi:MAG: glycosyltransferase [Myxococcota bacterium]|jgi:N-acetylgalactosamine-N,N'-diacetylbacillosaminyl-diphospho-undecaprenol 4-alpha-N-acetylgalactosaminyltransferase|nr:glycosyltransferase [Myxococcota bacterium]